MTDEELIALLRKADEYEPLGHDGWAAADRIEALVKELSVSNEIGRAFEEDAGQQRARAEQLAATCERLEAALRELHHAVCGETGFAACVRLDSGKAYPWPALDEADAAARAALKGADHE